MNRTYLVVFEKGADSWSAFAPDVAGTGGMGDTLEAARQSLRAGIHSMFQYLAERDIPIPEATSTAVDFSEFDPNPSESHYEVEWLTVDLPEFRSHHSDQAKKAA